MGCPLGSNSRRIYALSSHFFIYSCLADFNFVLDITKTCPCNKQRIFQAEKTKSSIEKFWYFFPNHRYGFNEYPQSMFAIWTKNIRKIGNIPQFYYRKEGYIGVCITRTCCHDEKIVYCMTVPLYWQFYCCKCCLTFVWQNEIFSWTVDIMKFCWFCPEDQGLSIHRLHCCKDCSYMLLTIMFLSVFCNN